MLKIGFAVDDLSLGDLPFLLIRACNDLAEKGGVDPYAFYETLVRPCVPPAFPAMPLAEAWGFDGVLVATSLSTARAIARFPAAAKKVFLCWDLEWLRLPRKDYRALQSVYAHPELVLAARSADHANALRSAWSRPAFVAPGLDPFLLASAE